MTQGNFILTLYSHSCVLICIRTAVNSICLGTCLNFLIWIEFRLNRLSLKAGAKVQLLFNLASLKTSFLKENYNPLFNKLLNFAILILNELDPFWVGKDSNFLKPYKCFFAKILTNEMFVCKSLEGRFLEVFLKHKRDGDWGMGRGWRGGWIQEALAQSEAQSPQWKKIGFLGPKERPKEAPFGT